MVTGFIESILAYFEAISFIKNKGFGKYFLYSGLIGLVLLAICGYIVLNLSPMISIWVEKTIPWKFDFLSSITHWLSIGLSSLFFISIFKYMMLIFTAPLMSVLSDKVEREMTGYSSDKNFIINFFSELLRAIRINLRNIVREILLTILILLLGLFPVFSLISGVLIILIQSYFAGFGNFDFWAERHFNYSNTVRYMKQHKGMLMGNGIVYIFLLTIPILGAFIGPPLATVASTMQGVKYNEQYIKDD